MVTHHHGPIAQLDRASVFETEGWAFESLWDHHPIRYCTRNIHNALDAKGAVLYETPVEKPIHASDHIQRIVAAG